VITPHALYTALGPTDADRADVYRALVKEPLDDAMLTNIRNATQWGVDMRETVQEPRRGRPLKTRPAAA
jgi:hypothetical protein